MKRILVFNVDSIWLGIDAFYIERIIKVPQLNKLPSCHYFLEGVTVYENQILSIINLKKYLSLGDVSITDGSSIIVVNVDGQKVGFIADMVDEILEIDEKDIQKSNLSNAFNSIFKLDEKIIGLFDVPSIVNNLSGKEMS